MPGSRGLLQAADRAEQAGSRCRVRLLRCRRRQGHPSLVLPQNAGVPGSVSNDLGLGLGDQLQQQTEAAILERRKKLMAMASQAQAGAAYGDLTAGTGLMNGMGNIGQASKALLGMGGF